MKAKAPAKPMSPQKENPTAMANKTNSTLKIQSDPIRVGLSSVSKPKMINVAKPIASVKKMKNLPKRAKKI